MAQGSLKSKLKVPNMKNKQKHGVRKQSMKKQRGRYIQPKNAKVKENEKLKLFLEKEIKTNIENEVSSVAISNEAKKFHIVKLSKQAAGRIEKKRKQKGKK
ncbi:Hypothetical predicted protein [Octopus vulgaris]|uniref:Uncharacterized protein n=2 Tax=Octopus TaxID=6643 RepID=A0AA36BJU6_OCTVU|nr:uncharacterized protein LOC115222657 [Octopus sinensis]CAI9734756.1 Hypothetical predicted protein [Octopus vulgaris]